MNTNFTSMCAEINIGSVFSVGYFAVPCGAFVLCQNLITILTIWRWPKLHTNANIFIVSVSLTDILLSLSYSINHLVHITLFSSVFFMFATLYSNALLSMNQMGTIAVDRYIYIAHLFFYMKNITKKRVIITLACVWGMSLVFLITPLFVYTDVKYHNRCINLNPL
jgi:hypothetical protein